MSAVGAGPGEGVAPEDGGVYRHRVVARFGDCDPAGIVYFPRFFDWFHVAMEAWFGAALGQPYHELLQRYGLPAVHTEADYAVPVRFGDVIHVELRLGRLGGSSVRLDYRVVGEDGGLRATGSTTCVLMGTDPALPDHMAAVPIPDRLRERLERFRGTPGPRGPSLDR